jgi:GT2 family glycosyltransferase
VAGGFNPGIERALVEGADYVCILNNDTIVEPDIFAAFLKVADAPDVGILMPKILYSGDRSRVWSAGARYRPFPPAIVMRGLDTQDGLPGEPPRFIDYAPTCVLLIARRTFEQVGLLDDGYFFFFDDWDFSLRVRRAHLRICYVPQARVYHKVSRTIQKSGRPPFFWRTWGSSAARFYRRFGHPPVLSAAWHLGYLALREGSRNGPGAVRYFLEGAIDSWRKPLTSPARYGGSGLGE